MADEHTLVEQNGHTMMHTYIYIHPPTNVPTKCQPSTPYGIQEIAQRRFKTHGHYDKVKGQIKVTVLQNDVAHLQPITSIPTKYQLSTPYGFQNIDWTRFYRSRSLQQGQRSNQGHTIMLHTYTSSPMPLPINNFLHLTVSEIVPEQDFIGQGHNGKFKGQIKVTLHTYTT